MNDKIIELEEYKKLIENKNGLDNGTTCVDNLSLEELEDVNKLHLKEVYKIAKEIQGLEKENKRLKKLLEKQ